MRHKMTEHKCELCGTPVRIVGKVTKNYEPITEEMIDIHGIRHEVIIIKIGEIDDRTKKI